MELLEAYGMDIINDKEKQNRYHVGNRLFQLAELKLLVDAVKFAKFITAEKSSELITKLKSLTSVHEAERLERNDGPSAGRGQRLVWRVCPRCPISPWKW